MITSHPIEGNFTSNFTEDLEPEADDKIVIDKLLINKLTELLINSIYSVHVSRRSEIFLTSLDMHLAENSISNKNNKASHEFTEKSSLLLESYQKAVPKLLVKAESSLEEAIDLINLVVSASETGGDNG
jgi:predicted nucleotidyltransferase component of viral defense system